MKEDKKNMQIRREQKLSSNANHNKASQTGNGDTLNSNKPLLTAINSLNKAKGKATKTSNPSCFFCFDK